MDISVLPNNNHPDKFLQLDVGTLGAAHGVYQVGALLSTQRHWQNRVYWQEEQKKRSSSPEGSPVVFVDRYLEKHITPVTLKSNIKRNPLYTDIRLMDTAGAEKFKPSWTVKEYDTQTIHGNLADYLKEDEKTPRDLDFWLEDLYTPGFDSLLKRKEAENRKKMFCKIFSVVFLCVCTVVVVIVVTVVVMHK